MSTHFPKYRLLAQMMANFTNALMLALSYSLYGSPTLTNDSDKQGVMTGQALVFAGELARLSQRLAAFSRRR